MPTKRTKANIKKGAALHYFRRLRGMKQPDFAAKMGVNVATASLWENGHIRLTEARIEQACNVLKIKKEDFDRMTL